MWYRQALVLAGLIAEQVPNTQAVRGRDKRGRQGMQRARPDGGNHGGLLPRHPAQGGRGVRGFDLAAQAVDLEQPGSLVDAQHLANFGGAVSKNCQEGFNTLAQ
jgi:hypothetical protein